MDHSWFIIPHTDTFFRYTRIALCALACISSICAIILGIRLIRTIQADTTARFEQARASHLKRTEYINTFLSLPKKEVERIVAAVNATSSEHDLKEILLKKPAEISGSGYIQQDGVSAYMVEKDDTLQYQSLDSAITAPLIKLLSSHDAQYGIFNDPVSNEKSIYYAQAIAPNKYAVSTISLTHLDHILGTLYNTIDSYSFLLRDHQVIIHPSISNFNVQSEIARATAKFNATAPEKTSELNDTEQLTYDNEITGNNSWLFVSPLKIAGLEFGSAFESTTVLSLPTWASLRHTIYALVIACVIALLLILFTIAPIYHHTTTTMLWLTSIGCSLILLLGIAVLWLIAAYYPNYHAEQIIQSKANLYTIMSKDSTHQQLSKNPTDDELLRYRYKHGLYVPTGILINDIQFTEKDQVEFVGFIWQRYFKGIHDNISRGFILPQMAGEIDLIEINKTSLDKSDIIMWQIHATINQNMNYSRYPFDAKDLKIQLQHKDFEKNVLLVPDIDSYTLLIPSSLPGISTDASILNWHITSSYFGYHTQHYMTNFGLYAYGPFGIYKQADPSKTPELHMHITTERYILSSIATDLLVLAVIAIILFALLITYFSSGGFEFILNTCGAAFFSTIFAQIQFRSKLPTHEFVYFESFYFTVYLVIITILITTLVHLFKFHVPVIIFRNNLITKLCYWPFILGCIFIATIKYLY